MCSAMNDTLIRMHFNFLYHLYYYYTTSSVVLAQHFLFSFSLILVQVTNFVMV